MLSTHSRGKPRVMPTPAQNEPPPHSLLPYSSLCLCLCEPFLLSFTFSLSYLCVFLSPWQNTVPQIEEGLHFGFLCYAWVLKNNNVSASILCFFLSGFSLFHLCCLQQYPIYPKTLAHHHIATHTHSHSQKPTYCVWLPCWWMNEPLWLFLISVT